MADEAASAIVTGCVCGRNRPLHGDATWKSLARCSSSKLLQEHGYAGMPRLFEPYNWTELGSWIDVLRDSIRVLLTLFCQSDTFPYQNAANRRGRYSR